MSMFLAAFGFGLGLLGAQRKRASSGETVVTGPGASTGSPLGLLLTITQA